MASNDMLTMDEKRGEVLRRLQAATERLASSANEEELDISVLFSKARALVRANDEIWERCRPNHRSCRRDALEMFRMGYRKVTVTSSRTGTSHRSIEVRTTSELETKAFALLPRTPEELQFFQIKPADDDGGIFPFDYNECLTSICCTKDDIARNFLLILKDHLERVQLALGEIETWLRENAGAVPFLNETFQCGLSVPSLEARKLRKGGKHVSREFVPTSHTLKEIAIGSTNDSYQLTFDLGMDNDLERLRRFLHFVEAPGTSAPTQMVEEIRNRRFSRFDNFDDWSSSDG